MRGRNGDRSAVPTSCARRVPYDRSHIRAIMGEGLLRVAGEVWHEMRRAANPGQAVETDAKEH